MRCGPKREQHMWIMVITFLFYGNPVTGHFSPALSSIEFSSKATCEAARTTYLSGFNDITAELNKAIMDEINMGQLKGPNGVVVSALCTAK
jgi:hypothetical protein